MVIELVGLMGSGKSTILRQLHAIDSNVQRGLSLRRARYLPTVITAALRAPVELKWFDRRSLDRPGLIVKLCCHLDAQLNVLARTRFPHGGSVVFEEGPVFKLCWISLYARRANLAGPDFDGWLSRRIIRSGEVMDRVVWLDAPNEVLLQRVRNRDHQTGYGLKYKSTDEAFSLYDDYRRLYRDILSRLEHHTDIPVTNYDTSACTLQDVVESIHKSFLS